MDKPSCNFVSLHNYTCYSILRAINKPQDLIERAQALGMKSVAITDYCSLAGIWEASKVAKKIKLIVGCEFNYIEDKTSAISFNNNELKDKPVLNHKKVIFIAKNQIGYKNLLSLNFESEKCKLDKNSKIDKVPLIDWQDITNYHEGLICLTGNVAGIVGKELSDGFFDKAKAEALRFFNLFGDDFAFELQPNNLISNGLEQFAANQGLYRLSQELGIQCIAASNAYYTEKEQAKYQDFLLAMKHHRRYKDRSRLKLDKPNFYLHTDEEIVAFFKRNYGQEFAEKLCENTINFSNKCEKPTWVKPQNVTKENVLLPEFPVKDQPDYQEFCEWVNARPEIKEEVKAEDKLYMRYVCEKKLDMISQDKKAEYQTRYIEELKVYEPLNFCSYMLITADFIQWGRDNGVRVGPGRGSVGGSLVAYFIGIHKADPIKYGLIFERFLNIEKGEFPDCDNDFDSVGRERVLNYVTNKYGHNMVAHVSNFVTFTPKNAVTDVISCFEIGGSRTDAFRIAKNITETLPDDAKTIKAAMDSSPLLSEFVAQYPEVKEFAEIYIGLPRSYSTHAAGVVISKYPLNGLVPLRIDDFGNVCLEYEKTKAEENGLIKIDFLGLETLNIIETTNSIIKSLGLPDPADPPDCEKYDKIIYDLISAGDTFGVFQLGESGGTIDLCKKIEPHSLEDLAVINALTRPGVSPDVKRSYIERRFGREEIEIPHPNFERAVKATMGLPIFEECFLFLAHYFCGWNLSQSDKMRKISKLKAKGKHLLAELKENFIKGAMEASNVEEEFVQKIWDEWVVPLSGYAFNKSHAILYSMTSFHTAYLKAYYFAPFMTAKLISDTKSNSPKAKDKVLKGRHCLRKNNVIIKPPDVNLSEAMYKLVSNTELVTGFSALHGVKEPAALEIINKRPFNDFEDFLMKVDASKVRAPVIEALAACGALDCFGLPRKTMFMYVADLRKKLKAFQKKKSSNDKLEYALSDQEWNKGEIRALERHYIGEALSGKKEDSFPSLFTNDNITYIKDFENLPDKFRIICELEIKDLFIFKVKNKESKIYNEEICRMLGEDIKGDQVGIVMFPEQLELFKAKYDLLFEKSKIEKGFGIRLAGTINRFQGEASITTSDIYALMKPVDLPLDYKERKKVEIYSATSKKKMLKKKQEDIEEDLFALLKGE